MRVVKKSKGCLVPANCSLVDVYRNSEIFRSLHAPETFHGKCGACEYSHICGGSRARAYAYSGDPLATDPFCPYEPAVAQMQVNFAPPLSL